ncbi:MAG: glucose-6-phosphate isomerase family protein [Chloroflexota bacterium]
MLNPPGFITFQPTASEIVGYPAVERRLSQLDNVFADPQAFAQTLAAQDNPLVYSVSSVAPAEGNGQLHYGLGKIMPGKVGQEYFMTRGHYHEWREAAEIYLGLSGTGYMLLETEGSDDGQLIPLLPNSIVYVPGFTAHRTINTGDTPLTYLGIYPAEAGHDYGALAQSNFRHVVVDVNGEPTLLRRAEYLAQLSVYDEATAL